MRTVVVAALTTLLFHAVATHAAEVTAPLSTRSIPANPPVSYLRYCGSCHGVLADGNGPSAHRFDTPARGT